MLSQTVLEGLAKDTTLPVKLALKIYSFDDVYLFTKTIPTITKILEDPLTTLVFDSEVNLPTQEVPQVVGKTPNLMFIFTATDKYSNPTNFLPNVTLSIHVENTTSTHSASFFGSNPYVFSAYQGEQSVIIYRNTSLEGEPNSKIEMKATSSYLSPLTNTVLDI